MSTNFVSSVLMHSEIYRFIHFSDIHFGQEKNGTLVVHEDIRAQAIRDCRVIAEQLGSVHGILVIGDIAYSGKRKEYQRAGDWLDEIISAVGCGESAVFVVPGNHDIDKDKIGFIGDITHDTLRKASIEQVDGILEKISKDEEAITLSFQNSEPIESLPHVLNATLNLHINQSGQRIVFSLIQIYYGSLGLIALKHRLLFLQTGWENWYLVILSMFSRTKIIVNTL